MKWQADSPFYTSKRCAKCFFFFFLAASSERKPKILPAVQILLEFSFQKTKSNTLVDSKFPKQLFKTQKQNTL